MQLRPRLTTLRLPSILAVVALLSFLVACGSSSKKTVTSIQLTNANGAVAQSIPVAGTLQYFTTAVFSNSQAMDVTAAATYTSSDMTVATIGADGVATGVAAGTTTITTTYNGFTATDTLTVTATAQ